MTLPQPEPTSPKATAYAGESTLLTWGQVSSYLLDVERRELWKSTAASFTEWVAAFSRRRDISTALIWRYKSAGTFYRQRAAAHESLGKALPDLNHLPSAVSAESLELLSKLFRAAPKHVLDELEPRVLSGEATRQELRSIWQTYRPLLEGRTARGKGVDAPAFEGVSAAQISSRAEADALLGLHRFGGEWAGHLKPHLYRVMPMTGFIRVSSDRSISIDAVVLIQPTAKPALEIHGIQIKGAMTLDMPSRDVIELPQCVDFAWVALADASAAPDSLPLPLGVGLLTANASKIVAVRKAVFTGRAYSPSEQLARELLLRSLRA